MKYNLVIGSDCNGFELKKFLILTFKKAPYKIHDVGCFFPEKEKEECENNYETYGHAVARLVSAQSSSWRGIAICGNGIGMSIITNKDPYIRGALCCSEEDAVTSRKLCDSNVIVLPALKLTNHEANNIVNSWLSTFNCNCKGCE